MRISSANVTKSAVSFGFVAFTEEILNGKHYFLCSDTANVVKDICIFPTEDIQKKITPSREKVLTLINIQNTNPRRNLGKVTTVVK